MRLHTAFAAISGEYGLYRSAGLLTFADNHDVNRVATRTKNPAHLYPLYCLLYTVPGIPAIYYGSEFGIKGAKTQTDDWSLRPTLDLGGSSSVTAIAPTSFRQ